MDTGAEIVFCDKDKNYISAQLKIISNLLPKYAMGDFSESIRIPKTENEFTEIFVGMNLMVEDIREIVNEQKQTIKILKNTEDKINKEKEKFSSLINSSTDIIMRMEVNGTISFINNEYANKKPEQLIGELFYDIIPSEFKELAKEAFSEVFETSQTKFFENIGLSRNGKIKWYRNTISPIKTGNKVTAFTVIATDISEIKHMDIMNNEFIASISHEIRTPLTIIRESLSILAEGVTGKLNNDQMAVVKPCIEDVDRLARIINNLLDISKMNEQKMKIEYDLIDIVELVNNVVSSFQRQADKRNIELSFKTDFDQIEMYMDRDRIIQVLMNLIGNALKFVYKGKVEIEISDKEDEIIICVTDTGIGIEDNNLGTVFDRFHQVGQVMSSGERGSGLGLTISKCIVKQHGGKIWVNSKINVGSKFYFSLPKLVYDQIIEKNIQKGISEAKKNFSKMTLLFIKNDNYLDLVSKFGPDNIEKFSNNIVNKIKYEIAPSASIFKKNKNEFILFSDITKQNSKVLIMQIKTAIKDLSNRYPEDFLAEFSTGIACYPDDGKTTNELVKYAESSLKINDVL